MLQHLPGKETFARVAHRAELSPPPWLLERLLPLQFIILSLVFITLPGISTKTRTWSAQRR